MLPATYMAPTGLLLYALSPAFQKMEQKDYDALRDSMIEQGAQVPIAINEERVHDVPRAWPCLVLQGRPDAWLRAGIASSTAKARRVEVS